MGPGGMKEIDCMSVRPGMLIRMGIRLMFIIGVNEGSSGRFDVTFLMPTKKRLLLKTIYFTRVMIGEVLAC